MTTTDLYSDPVEGTYIEFHDKVEHARKADVDPFVRITVAHAPFSKLTIDLDLDDCDRLLAVVDHAEDPWVDLAEFFETVYHCQRQPAHRAARAFVLTAPGLDETIR